MSRSASQPVGQNLARYDIPAFVADIERVVAAERDPRRVAAEVERRLPRLLATPDLLTQEQRATLPDRYCPNLVAVAPSGAFSVVALVWQPGQMTPIHDHICWCVVGVLEGAERETRYHLLRDAMGELCLCPAGEDMMTPGMTCALVPPEENIHQVRNDGAALAISLHVYGADLATVATHSSINECFDHVPLRADATGTPVPWRNAHS
jgi:predicted metal-dependent enzyme (double-stranded beta helix superfamily)